jgi:mannose-6-phosphate isomerase-like protein (cupin superfamily)
MNIDGHEVVVRAGSIVKFPQAVMHDVRNLGPERCVIMFLKVNPKVLKGQHDG